MQRLINRKSQNGRLLTASDVLFFVLFALLALYFFTTANTGITISDETQYQYVCQRLMRGEKLIADNWMIVGMQTVFQYLPFRAYVLLHGGTQGLILAMRYFYVCVKLCFFLYIYARLREHGFWALAAGVLFVGTDLFGIKTASYYSICVQTVSLTGMALFMHPKEKKFCSVAAGFIFSCSVLVVPVAAAVWVFYSALVLLRAASGKRKDRFLKNYDFILSPRRWVYIFIGICSCALLFLILCAVFFTGVDLSAITSGVKIIFRFVNSSAADGTSFSRIRLSKILTYTRLYHPALLILFAAALIAGMILRRFTSKYNRICFAVMGLLAAALNIRLLLLPEHSLADASGECVSHPLMISLLAAAAYVYTKEKNRRLFAFLALSFSVSLVFDAYSNNSFGSMLLSGSVPAVLLLKAYCTEQWAEIKSAEKTVKKPRTNHTALKISGAALCAILVLFSGTEIWHYAYMARFHETERLFVRSAAPLDAKIESGALKGVLTTEELKENYEKSVRDTEKIRRICKNTFLSVDYDTSVYLNADLPVASPIPHFFGNDWSREEIWWEMHPEKRPDVVYVPFTTLSYIDYYDPSPEEKIAYFENKAAVSVTEGEFGYILRIDRWY